MRLIRVDRAYWNPVTSAVADGSLVAALRYDGAGRRIVKAITNSADWNRTDHEYYDGQRRIETRNDLGQVLKQYVWGLGYIDELVQIAINPDPQNATSGTYQENRYERFFWALQDANYNVLGVVLPTGRLIERYEYTPYGQRTVYSHGWLLADADGDGAVGLSDQSILATHWNQSGEAAQVADLDGNGVADLADQAIVSTWYNHSLPAADPLVTYGRLASAAAPTAQGPGVALCDIGHQGLLLDVEFGLYHNRARAYHPTLMRFAQRDPLGYVDGMNVYQYVQANPVRRSDSSGLYSSDNWVPCGGRSIRVRTDWCCGATVWSNHEVGDIENAVCSAYRTLNAAKNKVWSLRGQWPLTRDPSLRPDPCDYFENFFHPQAGPWVATGVGSEDFKSAEGYRQEAVESVLATYWAVVSAMESGNPPTYQCGLRDHEGECNGQQLNVLAWGGPGRPVLLCGGWFMRGAQVRTGTIIHELTHALANSSDEAWSGGALSGNYIGDAYGSNNPTTYSVGWRPLDPTHHASSLEHFAMLYYVP